MSERISRHAVGRTFDFRHDALASLSARIRHIRVRETGQTQRKVELSLELHYDAWIRMDTERWFGMSVGSIADAVRGYALQALLPVRVEIGLRSTAYGFVPTGLDVDATAAAMATELQQQS